MLNLNPKLFRQYGKYFILIIVLLVLQASASLAAIHQDRLNNEQLMQHARLPFIVNQGQLDRQVLYYAKTFFGAVFVERNGVITYSLPGGKSYQNIMVGDAVVLKEIFLGGTVDDIFPGKPSASQVAYFTGNQPIGWHNNISTYDDISFSGPYKGIDLKLKAYGDNVEKLFYISPGIDPTTIKIALQGANSLQITKEGLLEVKTDNGPVRFTAPLAWQEINGQKKFVEVSYCCLAAANKTPVYGFSTGLYDHTHTLIIDPVLASTVLGGDSEESGISMALDSAGNIYVAGKTNSLDFPVINNPFDDSFNGLSSSNYDIFISKFTPDLETLLCSTFVGGDGEDTLYGLVLDSEDNVYITGSTTSNNFPNATLIPDAGTLTILNGAKNVFVAKLNASLQLLPAAAVIGGTEHDAGHAIVVAENGANRSLYISGSTASDNFPTYSRATPYNATYAGNGDIFIVRLPENLSQVDYFTFLGGTCEDNCTSLAVDSSYNIYLTGTTCSANFPTTTGGVDASHNGNYDVFVSKLNLTLDSLLSSTYLGGTEKDGANCIRFDSSQSNVFITGYTFSEDFPVPGGAYDTEFNGMQDIFITSLSNDLTTISASTYLGGNDWDEGNSLAFSSDGSLFITGYTRSGNYPVFSDSYDGSIGGSVGYQDVFISRMNPALTSLQASTYLGGSDFETGTAMVVDSSDDIYVAGSIGGGYNDFPVTENAYDEIQDGSDAFVTKLDGGLSSNGVIEFSTSSYSVVENGSSVTITVSRKYGSYGEVSIDYLTLTGLSYIEGEAVVDFDFNDASGTLAWAHEDTTDKTFTVTIINDAIHEPEEFFRVAVQFPGGGAELGDLNVIPVIINDDDDAQYGQVQFESATYSTGEQNNVAVIAVTRTGGSDGMVSVTYSTSDGSAVAGTDYVATTGTILWNNDNDGARYFDISPIDNDVFDGDRTVNITLTSPDGGVTLGTQSTSILMIIDNEQPPLQAHGKIQFTASDYNVHETAGSVTLNVERVDGSYGAISIDYETADNEAQAGSDYTAKSGTLNWVDGDTSLRQVIVFISDDSEYEGNEFFNIFLSNPQGGVAYGSPKDSSIKILDDESPSNGSIRFEADSYSVDEKGNAFIHIKRFGETAGEVSIDVATSNGTAVAGEDYEVSSAHLIWPDGDATSLDIMVSISEDDLVEGDETVYITMSNPGGGATIGGVNPVVLTIRDDESSEVYLDPLGNCNGNAVCYHSLPDVINDYPAEPVVVKMLQGKCGENVEISATEISMFLRGGYNSKYTHQSGLSTIAGKLTLSGGTVWVENILITGQ